MAPRFYSLLGNSQKLDGGAMFGNAPKALWQRWTKADDRNRIDLACRALLVDEGDRKILFETGVGAFFDPHMRDRFGVNEPEHVLLQSLEAVGLSHESIDVVVLSHLHFDHAGGLLSAWEEGVQPFLLFPHARYIVGRTAWERAIRPHPRDKASFIPHLNRLLEESGRLEIVEGNSSEHLGARYRFHVSNGHTPGMLLTEINTPIGPVVFGGDLVPGTAWVHHAITMGYDRFPELLIDEKTQLLHDLVQRGGHIFFTHDPDHALAAILLDERNRFQPSDHQSHLTGSLS